MRLQRLSSTTRTSKTKRRFILKENRGDPSRKDFLLRNETGNLVTNILLQETSLQDYCLIFSSLFVTSLPLTNRFCIEEYFHFILSQVYFSLKVVRVQRKKQQQKTKSFRCHKTSSCNKFLQQLLATTSRNKCQASKTNLQSSALLHLHLHPRVVFLF